MLYQLDYLGHTTPTLPYDTKVWASLPGTGSLVIAVGVTIYGVSALCRLRL
jgi:hypothetical protein